MGKGRNKKNAKQNTASKPLQSASINLPENMSAEEMQHIIACAIIEAEKIKERKRQELEKQKSLEWQKSIGYKDFSGIEYKLWRNIKIIVNKIRRLLTVMFIRKKKISGARATAAFLQYILIACFSILQIISLIACVIFFVMAFAPEFLSISPLGIFEKIIVVLFAVGSFLYSCIFRIIKLEIDKIKDHNYLFGLFAAITSFVSIIIAVIAIVKGA